MRYSDFKLVESRGVTARDAGEVYVNVSDPDKTLAIQQIYVISPANTNISNKPNKPSLSTAYINQLKTEFEKNPDAANATVIINQATVANLKDLTSAGIPMLSDMANKALASRNVAGAFETAEDMLAAVDENIPAGATKVEDNKPSLKTRAAIIAHTINQDSEDEWHIRYVEKIPPTGVHGLWKTFNGYQYAKSAKQENVPIKPADLIQDANPRSIDQLIVELKANLERTLSGTEYSPLTEVMHTAIDLAAQGAVEPIPNSADYQKVIAKYGGEYLGIIAVAKGGVRKGDIDKMLDAMNMDSLVGSEVIFPQNKSEELIDSILITPNGTRLEVSTKMHQGGGAASSLSGVTKLINADIAKKFPKGAKIIRLLGTASASSKDPRQAPNLGIVVAAKEYGIINDEDILSLANIDPSAIDIEVIKAPNLNRMTKSQGIDPRTINNPDYRVWYHALAAIANDLIIAVNKDQEFADAMMAALNNNNYLQMLTDVRKRGDAITCDYYGKFPAVFKGKPVLYNKVYYATGQKGRIGFKLK
jgi:hypothetical protein